MISLLACTSESIFPSALTLRCASFCSVGSCLQWIGRVCYSTGRRTLICTVPPALPPNAFPPNNARVRFYSPSHLHPQGPAGASALSDSRPCCRDRRGQPTAAASAQTETPLTPLALVI